MLQDLPFADLQGARERLDRWLSLAIAFGNESQPFARDARQWMISMLFWDAGRRRLGDEWSDPIRPLFVELAAVRDRPVRVGGIIAASASQTLVQVDNRLRLWLITCGFHKWLDAAIVLTESTLGRELILDNNDDFMGLCWALSVNWRQGPIECPDPQWRRVAERLRTDSQFWEAGAAVQAENFVKHVRETLDFDPWQMGAELDLEFSKASQRRLAVDANPPSNGAIGLEERALALLVAHPDWTDTQIAKEVPCSRTTLYKWKNYVAAREALKTARLDVPRGSKDKDGTLDAWQGV